MRALLSSCKLHQPSGPTRRGGLGGDKAADLWSSHRQQLFTNTLYVSTCAVLTHLSPHCGVIERKEDEGRMTSVSQVITQGLAIHSGIALTGPRAKLFIAASSVLTHSLMHTIKGMMGLYPHIDQQMSSREKRDAGVDLSLLIQIHPL